MSDLTDRAARRELMRLLHEHSWDYETGECMCGEPGGAWHTALQIAAWHRARLADAWDAGLAASGIQLPTLPPKPPRNPYRDDPGPP